MEEEEEIDDDEDESANPRDVGHNIYILAHQVMHLYNTDVEPTVAGIQYITCMKCDSSFAVGPTQ